MSKMKAFTTGKVKEPIKFSIDEDEFEAISPDSLPAGALATYFEKINEGHLFAAHEDLFRTILTEEGLAVFQARLNSTDNPINIKMLGEVSAWLLGEMYMGEASGESKES